MRLKLLPPNKWKYDHDSKNGNTYRQEAAFRSTQTTFYLVADQEAEETYNKGSSSLKLFTWVLV